MIFEFIDKDTDEKIMLEGPYIFTQEDYNKYRNQFYKYQNNLIAIVEKVEEKHEEKEELVSSTFNPKYTFDNFVVGSSNQFVAAAA